MKTLKLITLIALASVAFSSCSDNGPTSINDRDANTLKSTAEQEISITLQIPEYDGWDEYTWDGRGTDSEKCDVTNDDLRPASGWIHWVFSTKGSSTDAVLVLKNGDDLLGEFSPGPPLDANVWHFYTPFFDLNTLSAKVYLKGEGDVAGPGGGLVISDFCPGDDEPLIKVTKTVVTEYTRKHKWSIDKKVETENEHELDGYPKIWLYTDGTGNEKANWTIDVSYDGYKDIKHNVSGKITIKNIGSVDATIESIVDKLAGEVINVNCGDIEYPYLLPIEGKLTCTYDEDGYVEGDNVVKVTVDGVEDPFKDTKPIVWGDPTTEVNETVNIKDISDLFGEKNLGSVTAPNGDSFTYKKYFKWSDYGADDCGSFTYDNTATIVETEQDAEATLKVNVQCFVYDSAWANGDGPVAANKVESFCDNGFNNWGWTNKIAMRDDPYEWDLYAGAGQCDINKGTKVGTIVVTYNGSGFDYDFKINPGIDFKDPKVYAGNARFPTLNNGRPTTAPGQYSILSPLNNVIWVIAHGVVGQPDPNFNP